MMKKKEKNLTKKVYDGDVKMNSKEYLESFGKDIAKSTIISAGVTLICHGLITVFKH